MGMSTTEPGESSTAAGNGNSLMSIIFGDSQQKFSMGGLINVPEHLLKVDKQAFTPLLISIGPIHRSNAKLQSMEKVKVLLCDCFIKRAKIDFKNLLQIIGEKQNRIRSYYAETVVSDISDDDFAKMIVVDGMFILEYFLRESNPGLVVNDPTIAEWMPPILKFDLVLLENQLPISVLDMLFDQVNFGADLQLQNLSVKQLAFKFFQSYKVRQLDYNNFIAEIEHFTDLVRLFYIGEALPARISGGAKLSYSAIQLHEAGVKLKGVEFYEEIKCYSGNREFLDIRFDSNTGVLEIPCIKLNDEKIRLIRNIIALEQSNYVGHAYFTDFFVILDFLIDTSRDVDLLCDKGILINYLGDSKAAALAVNNLNKNILWDYINSDYSKICEDLNAFCKKPLHKWRATLCHQYFSTPWRAASTFAAIILLLLTAIQTVCSVKSTKW